MKGYYATLTSREHLFLTGEEFLRRLPNAGELMNVRPSDKLFIKIGYLNNPEAYHTADLFVSKMAEEGFPFVFPISQFEYEALVRK